jgi:hypothetical protein
MNCPTILNAAVISSASMRLLLFPGGQVPFSKPLRSS